MTRARFWLPVLGVALTQLACKGQEVAVFEMPGGSGGQAGSSSGSGSGGSSAGAGSPAAAGDMSGGAGGVAGSAAVTPGGSGGMAGGGGGMAGAGGMPLGMPCTTDMECGLGWLCEKPGCDAPSGVCEPRPVFLPPEPDPVCGCDGHSYWNDAIRRAHGATLAALGECRASACSCEVGADCEVEGASCSHLVAPGEMCGHGTGICWVLPPQCVPTGDPMIWEECRPPDAPDPPPPCVDTCLAIQSERPHAPPHHGVCK